MVSCLRRQLFPSARCNPTISLRSVELHGGGRLAGAIAPHAAHAASRSINATTTTACCRSVLNHSLSVVVVVVVVDCLVHGLLLCKHAIILSC